MFISFKSQELYSTILYYFYFLAFQFYLFLLPFNTVLVKRGKQKHRLQKSLWVKGSFLNIFCGFLVAFYRALNSL